MDIYDQLRLVTASHVKLMTDHELFVKEHEAFVKNQEREWEWQQERWRQYDIEHQKQLARGADLDKRIADLVSGIGEFIARSGK